MWIRRDLTDRVSRWREGVSLAEIFAPEPHRTGSVLGQAERAQQILGAQDRVLDRFDNLSILPERTVSFIHRDQVYLAPHFNWGGIPRLLSLKAAAIFAATQLGDPTAIIAAITAAGNNVPLNPGQINTCFKHTGFTYANVHDSFNATAGERIDIDNPSLLFFDHGGTLIGCGWFRPIAGSRSVFGSPLDTLYDEWFIHVSGKHTNDGGFKPDHKIDPRHHDEFWDVHLFFSRDDLGNAAGIPTVGMTMATGDVPAPPNVAHAASPGAVNSIICADGMSSAGLYKRA